MKAPDIEKIIANENDRREDEVRNRARKIISEIVGEQENIAESNKKIAELRSELTTLEAAILDPKSVLGQ